MKLLHATIGKDNQFANRIGSEKQNRRSANHYLPLIIWDIGLWNFVVGQNFKVLAPRIRDCDDSNGEFYVENVWVSVASVNLSGVESSAHWSQLRLGKTWFCECVEFCVNIASDEILTGRAIFQHRLNIFPLPKLEWISSSQ